MITLKDFMETVDYRITEGSTYGWSCFGLDAYMLDSWNGDQNGHSLTITFDTKTQVVYMVEAHDFKNQRAYRMINPEYKDAHDEAVKIRGIEDSAWEDDSGKPVEYTDLDVDRDFLEKARAIVAGEDYDTRVQVSVDFTNEEILQYALMAHEQDITLNQLIEGALRDMIDRHDLLKEWK
jgi:predicted HicB family RNase H-like nuclease